MGSEWKSFSDGAKERLFLIIGQVLVLVIVAGIFGLVYVYS
jgi:hypothetical protein